MLRVEVVLGFALGLFVGVCYAIYMHRWQDKKIAAQQAKIDCLMLEFCPEDMTPEQMREWGRHQRPEPGCTFCLSEYYAGKKCPVCGKKTR